LIDARNFWGTFDIERQLGDVGDHEHRRPEPPPALISRDVGIARGDDAVEGTVIFLYRSVPPLDIGCRN